MSRDEAQRLLREYFPDRTIGGRTDNKIKYLRTSYLIQWVKKLGLPKERKK